jgi:glucose-6-phosphate isomerase
MVQDVIAYAQRKNALNISIIIVVGIGGSNLGTWAIQEALLGKQYNELTQDVKIYYADTVDSDYCAQILSIAQQSLEAKKRILIISISKSGTTTETIANMQVFYALLKKYYPTDYQQYMIIISDKNSPLYNFARKENIDVFTIPSKVGGRYSVFSPVGLLPLALLGVDIQLLVHGAQAAIKEGLSENIETNMSLQSAIIKYEHYKHNIFIHDLFAFVVDFESLGKWYRQLVGESLGKESSEGKPIGIVPTVSIGSTDLHSVGQLYLGGPIHIFTTFLTIDVSKNTTIVPYDQDFVAFANNIQNNSFDHIMHAIIQGVQHAYEERHRPYSIIICQKSPFCIGYLLQWCMIEVVLLGHLLKVNPFDQPHVELYKRRTREILAQ